MTRCRRSYLAVALLSFALALFASYHTASADPLASVAESRARTLDLTGVWLGIAWAPGQGIGPLKNTPWTPTPAFTTWGAAESKRLADPQLSRTSYCAAGEPVGMMTANPLFPMQIASAPGQLIIMMEGASIQRRIYVDGRRQAAEPDPSYLGHSVGHWEGDVLVVDTVGIKAAERPLNGFVSPAVIATPLDSGPRLPASERLHLIERIRLVGNGQFLEEEMTVSDPKVYTNTFSARFYSQRRPDLDIQEYYCYENPRPDSEGYVKADGESN